MVFNLFILVFFTIFSLSVSLSFLYYMDRLFEANECGLTYLITGQNMHYAIPINVAWRSASLCFELV